MQRIYATLYIQICFNSICTKIASEKIEVETKIHFLHIWLLTAFVQM